jgi:ribonucleoside-diphosphate reductase alpha chain
MSSANGTAMDTHHGAAVIPMKNTIRSSEVHPVGHSEGTWERVFTKEGSHPFDGITWKRVDAVIYNSEGEEKFRQDGVEVPEWWGQNTINVVADKYFRQINGVKENSVKQMFGRVASTLRKWAQDQNFFNTDKDAQVFEEELIYALLHQYGAFNSPVWFNLGVPGRRQAASACFISGVDDSLESINSFAMSEKTIFAGGSGSGANLSKIRSSYEKLSSGAYVCGPLGWMKEHDAGAGAMKSGGSTRNAAKMVVLDMDHPDILETHDKRPGFIRCKAVEEKRAHDLIKVGYNAAYDDPNSAYKWVAYQNANHSVSIPDAFMRAVESDGTWKTRERLSGTVVHTYRARDVWHEIAKAAWVCGDPGVQFTDSINRWHTTPNAGPIKASNPCSEFLHVDDTACNLCAVNLTKFFDSGQAGMSFNFLRFEHAVRIFSTAQMAIVDKAEYPTEKIRKNSLRLRPIGTNYGDLGALLMKLGYSYDSDEGRVVAARMASLMTGLVYRTAAKLAARVGSFPAFEENRREMLDVMLMHKAADRDILSNWRLDKDPLGMGSGSAMDVSSKIWDEVLELGSAHGFYVSQATLQAPLGTISFLMGMDTTGIEPAFSIVSYKSLVGGGSMKIVNQAVGEALRGLGYSDVQVADILAYVEENDFIEDAPHLRPQHLQVFDCAMPSGPTGRYLSPMAHIKMMAAIQPLITCAQSKTVNLPSTVTPEEIAEVYFESWKLGLKCIALYRDGCKMSQPLATKVEEGKVTPKSPIAVRRHSMPENVQGWRHRFEIGGLKGYVIGNEYLDGKLGEVFVRFGKDGSTVGGLMDGFTKLLSISLQHGVPLPKLISSFVHTKFEPSGFTSNPDIRFADSLYDYLFKLLDIRYFKGQNSGLDRLELETAPDSTPPPSEELAPSPRSKINYDGPPCSNCGGITRRNGSCYLCNGCGQTTGCS